MPGPEVFPDLSTAPPDPGPRRPAPAGPNTAGVPGATLEGPTAGGDGAEPSPTLAGGGTGSFGAGGASTDPVLTTVRVGPAPRFLGNYELLEELARGGMGVVYRARQAHLGRIVALKLVRDPALATYAEVRRFRQEAEAVAELDHPNIVPIYEVGQTEDQPYFSMKLVEGGSLSRHVARLQHHPRAVAALMEKVARAVQYAHQHAILHRDLKPSNILLGEDDEPYVTDFGLAKRIGPAGANAETMTGAVMGTPAYMPPEQAGGGTKSLTTAADVYSLGATLYEALTGRPPFVGDSPAVVLRKVIEGEPARPRSLAPDLDRDLETVCLKCLEKTPEKRYATAEELADDLQRWLELRPILARPATRRERLTKWVRRNPALAALIAVSMVALVGLAAGGGYFTRSLQVALDQANRDRYVADVNLARRAWDDGEVYRVREYLQKYRDPAQGLDRYRGFEWFYFWRLCDAPVRELAVPGGELQALAYAEDGGTLATGSSDGAVRLWEPETGRTLHTWREHAAVRVVLFSPDGALLASASADGTVRLTDVKTGECRRSLAAGGEVSALAFRPDGRALAATAGEEGRFVVWDCGSWQKTWTHEAPPDAQKSNIRFSAVAFSPDGARLYAIDHTEFGVSVFDVASRKRVALLPHGHVVTAMSLSGDGRSVLGYSGRGGITIWDAATFVKDEVRPGALGATLINGRIETSRDGGLVGYGPGARGEVRLWDLRGRHLVDDLAMPTNLNSYRCLALRPDGRRIAVAGKDRVYVTTVVTREPRPDVASDPGTPIGALAVRADGARLAWASSEGPRVVVWDGARGKAARTYQEGLVPAAHLAYGPAARPGLLAAAGPDGRVRVWDSDRDGPPLWNQGGHEGPVEGVAFLPDGRHVVSAGADGRLLFREAGTGRVVRAVAGGAGPLASLAVAPDGASVAAAGGDGSVFVWEVTTGRRVLGPLPFDGVATDLAFSPDGARLAAGGSTPNEGGAVVVWDASTGDEVSRWTTAGGVRSLVFSHDNRRLLTGGSGGALTVWDAETGRETVTLSGHRKAAVALARAPGLRVYSAGLDGVVKLWEGEDPGLARPLQAARDDGVYRRPPL